MEERSSTWEGGLMGMGVQRRRKRGALRRKEG